MSEYYSHDLPLEVDEDELRYILPWTFVPMANERGWDVGIEEGVDDNYYKVLYVMSRPVSADFDDGEVADMQGRIGIIDEANEIIDGYSLWTEGVKFWRGGADWRTGPPTSESNRLFFEFEGFPTDQTMDVMERLLRSFPPETKSGRWLRLLGYFGLYKTALK